MDAPTITACAACVAAIAALLGAARSFVNGQKLTELHVTMNSRLDALVKASVMQARSEGRAEGMAAREAQIAEREAP
jgi:hypothetical protein